MDATHFLAAQSLRNDLSPEAADRFYDLHGADWLGPVRRIAERFRSAVRGRAMQSRLPVSQSSPAA